MEKPIDQPRAGGPETVEILTIALGGEIFALPAAIVLEILDVGPVTPVPNAPAFVGNLINFRGRVAPLADLRLRCGMEVAAPTEDSRIVVLEFPLDGEPILAAILADEVYEVTRLDAVVTGQVPLFGTRWRPEFVQYIGRRNNDFVMVLDIGRIFASADSLVSPALHGPGGKSAPVD
jgi:purine-binding chemotaxis protein CheW